MVKEFPRRVLSDIVPILLSLVRVLRLAITQTVVPTSLVDAFQILSTRGKDRSTVCLEKIRRSFCLLLPVLIFQLAMKM